MPLGQGSQDRPLRSDFSALHPLRVEGGGGDVVSVQKLGGGWKVNEWHRAVLVLAEVAPTCP